MHKFAPLFIALITASTASFGVSAADPGNRACKIFTPDLGQSILGGPVKESSRNAEADTEVGKTWVSHAGYSLTGGDKSQVSLLIRHAASKEETKNVFEQSKATFKGVDVAGLGDAAYRTTTPPQLNVRKGSDWLIFMCGTFSAPDTAGQEKAAKAVLPKITD
ncbi:MAG: hypothetical protein JST89_24000 [Cyanobacteria bacterium SZAS-4]|nr:hypothetical protein [Cyanobacteria bacterium SZAS-4]